MEPPKGDNGPKMSVCMPNYNFGRYIGEAIQSVLNQTFTDFELIVVDDCSTDNSLSVIEGFSDPRIKLHRNERNLGQVKATNRCLSLASGEYISFLHSDDSYMPTMLERKVEVLDTNPRVGLVCASMKFIDEAGTVTGGYRYSDEDCIMSGEQYFERLALEAYAVAPTSATMRRECFAALGGFNEETPLSCDWEMWLRIALRYDVAFLAEPLAYYRKHDQSLTSHYAKANQWGMEKYRAMTMFFSSLPPGKEHLSYLEREAVRALARKMLLWARENLSRGQSKLARRNIALAIAIDDSLTLSWRTGFLFLATFAGRGMPLLAKLPKPLKRLLLRSWREGDESAIRLP